MTIYKQSLLQSTNCSLYNLQIVTDIIYKLSLLIYAKLSPLLSTKCPCSYPQNCPFHSPQTVSAIILKLSFFYYPQTVPITIYKLSRLISKTLSLFIKTVPVAIHKTVPIAIHETVPIIIEKIFKVTKLSIKVFSLVCRKLFQFLLLKVGSYANMPQYELWLAKKYSHVICTRIIICFNPLVRRRCNRWYLDLIFWLSIRLLKRLNKVVLAAFYDACSCQIELANHSLSKCEALNRRRQQYNGLR